MRLVVISDLHIQSTADPVYSSLLNLVEKQLLKGDVFVLAGDIFDALVGNKPVFVHPFRRLFRALEDAASRGVKIFYIEGNHDFLLKHLFPASSGVQLQPTSVKVQIDGKSFLIAHGDLADSGDYSYLFLRAILRSWVIRALVRILPGKWLKAMATRASHLNREKNRDLASQMDDTAVNSIRAIYREYARKFFEAGYDYVVMGHCHDLDEYDFKAGERTGQYINVGFPRVHQTYLAWRPGDAKISRHKFA